MPSIYRGIAGRFRRSLDRLDERSRRSEAPGEAAGDAIVLQIAGEPARHRHVLSIIQYTALTDPQYCHSISEVEGV